MQNKIASKLERSNITALTSNVHNGYTPSMHNEWTWYIDRPSSETRHDYQIWGVDLDKMEAYKVQGETDYEWLECHEMTTYLNADNDGNFYYVGFSDTNEPVAPPWSELKSTVAYAEDATTRPIQEWYTYSDWLAAYVLFKTSPKLALHKNENWV